MHRSLLTVVLTAAVAGISQGPVQAQHSTGSSQPLPAVYPTQAEAARAARQFHCQGAHRMETGWMPCANHGSVQGSTPQQHQHGQH